MIFPSVSLLRLPGILSRYFAVPALCLATWLTLAASPAAVAAGHRAAPVPVSARSLALRSSAFPQSARIQGNVSNNHGAQTLTTLHTATFEQLGRTTGFAQTATWTERPQRQRPSSLQIQYLASIFPSAAQAAAAAEDARSSLWELGRPHLIRVPHALLFTVAERDGHGSAYVVLDRGVVETEIRLRYSPKTSSSVSYSGVQSLHHTAGAAVHVADKVSSLLPASTSAASAPAPYVATWGAGPIVKSPSLLVPGVESVASSTGLGPGLFRPFSGSPLAQYAVQHASLIARPGLSRYGITALDATGGWYENVSLYDSSATASASFVALADTNWHRSWLRAYPLTVSQWRTGRLALVDSSIGWKMGDEVVVVLRVQNVVVVLSSIGRDADALSALGEIIAATVPTGLHSVGTRLVDDSGQPFRLKAINWYGAEQQDWVVGGLEYQRYQAVLETIKRLGFNAVRLPFSNQLVEQNPVVTAHLGANPDLQGLHALDIMNRIVAYAGAIGLSIILDNHRSDAGWSSQESGLWYTPEYPDTSFVRDWATMAQRYAVNDVVIGADLRNEPHGAATWGSGNPATDWLAAAERAGNAVLGASPHLMIFIEGIQNFGNSPGYWWGGNLMGVASAPAALQFPDGRSARSQLAYSAHDYGPDNCGKGCPWFNPTTSYDSLRQVWEQYWGYITSDPRAPYAAPVWIGEFGTCNYNAACVADTVPGSQGQWFSSLVRYIAEKNLSWAYWSANGTQSTASPRVYGSLDWYGFLDRAWVTPSAWIQSALQPIQAP